MSGKRGKEGLFGAPKPLPGQPGYKATESDLLEKDTTEMEMRLQALQERMKQQNLENEKNRQNGTSKWKSSKVEKGSVGKYGKEVTDKVKQKLAATNVNLLTGKSNFNVNDITTESFAEEALLQTTAPKPQRAPEPSKGLAMLDALQWTVADVGDWLTRLQLPQHAASFAQNEIDGRTLLDLTLEDLDYLSVTALAHRKTIFKAVEGLRAQRSGSEKKAEIAPRELLRSQSASKLQATVSAEELRVGATARSVSLRKEPEQSKIHWSQLQPLTSQEVRGGGNLINSADYQDVIDEEAERKAFQEAVMEWRRQEGQGSTASKGGVAIVREFEQRKPAATDVSDMWVNPFAAPAEPSPRPHNSLAGNPGDALDEAAEHAEFVKAVEAWRKTSGVGAGASKSAATSSAAVATSHGQQASLTQDGAKALAESLARALDQEQEKLQRQLEIQRRQAEQRLAAANADLQRMRAQLQHDALTAPVLDDVNDEGPGGFDDSMGSDPDELAASFSSHSVPSSSSAPPSRAKHNPTTPAPVSVIPTVSTVRVALVSSVLGQLGDGDDAGCVVQYASDDDG